MKMNPTKTLAIAFAGLSLFACNREEEQDMVAPLKATQEAELVGYDPSTCNLIQSFGAGELPRAVDVVEEDGAVMLVKAQRRGHNGKYLSEEPALLLNASDPATGLLNAFDSHMLGVSGLLTVGDAAGQKANQDGGRIILDFSPAGTVTMKSILVTDIAEDEKGSIIELFSSTGQLLDQKEVPVTGDNGAVFVTFDNVTGVSKAVVTFGAARKTSGSGAIGRLQLCVDGQGSTAEACSAAIQSVWLQYTGATPANVAVTAQEGTSARVIFSEKGMKPGTLFKLSAEDAAGFGAAALVLTTNKKEKQTISLACNASTALKKQYGSFRVVEARDLYSDYPLQLQ